MPNSADLIDKSWHFTCSLVVACGSNGKRGGHWIIPDSQAGDPGRFTPVQVPCKASHNWDRYATLQSIQRVVLVMCGLSGLVPVL